MISRTSEGTARDCRANKTTGFKLFFLLAAFVIFSTSNVIAQLPDLHCNDTLSLLISTQGFHLAQRSCVTITFDGGSLDSGCSSPEDMCCEPWTRDPLVCDPPGAPHNCIDNGAPVNHCCCWNSLRLTNSDGTITYWEYKWRGCRSIDQSTIAYFEACLDAGDYYWDPEYSTNYHCRKIYAEVKCPGCCP